MLFLYNLILVVAIGCLCPIWIPLVSLREKYRATVINRLAMAPISHNTNRLLSADTTCRRWIHALSVGEVMSAQPLVRHLSKQVGPESLVFTASTYTGYRTALQVMAPYVAAVRYFPYDLVFSVNRALRIIRPHQVIIVETDIWPTFLMRLQQCKIPVILVNARLSDRSWRGYKRCRPLMAPLLAMFTRICVQTELDRRRFLDVGAPDSKLVCVGNIKFDQPPIRLSAGDQRQLEARLNLPPGMPIWVAGSTHAGEEAMLISAYQRLRTAGGAPALVIAPRDPQRAVGICRRFQRAGLDAVLLKQAPDRDPPPRVVVIDRIGILRDLYTLADITFVGGSLINAGGHNPLEPASVAKPILAGPYTGDFRWIYEVLETNAGMQRVQDANELADCLSTMLQNQQQRARMGRQAFRVFRRHRGAVQRTVDVIDTLAIVPC